MIQTIVERTARCAKEAGARVFGFAQMGHPLDYRPMKPFGLCTWVGGLVGVIGRELAFDTRLLLRADIDFCLKSLAKDRIVWVDDRYCFVHKRFTGKGGNNSSRSAARHEEEIEILKQKWGGCLRVENAKTQTLLKIAVKR